MSPARNSCTYKRFLDDFACNRRQQLLGRYWRRSESNRSEGLCSADVRGVVERCLLMTTDPGDLVFDPTCGSGTTAFVAEQWGRRWITCDTSRVAITLAKQRLMTADFDYYKCSVRRGRGQRVRLQDRAARHAQVDRQQPGDPRGHDASGDRRRYPQVRRTRDAVRSAGPRPSKVRVTGPFTVEAVPARAVRPIESRRSSSRRPVPAWARTAQANSRTTCPLPATARRSAGEWRDELLA